MNGNSRWVVLRDLVIFQVKLLMDGFKDLVISQMALVAAAVDLVFPGPRRGHRFYAVMRLGERMDNWLSLYGASEHAEASGDGLFGASRAGSRTFLGKLEAMVLGREEPVDPLEGHGFGRVS